MSTLTVGPVRAREHTEHTAPLADLRKAHSEVARIVADLDPDAMASTSELHRIVSLVSAEAYAIAAVLADRPPVSVARDVPFVVRLRELAAAQRSLTGAIAGRRDPAPLGETTLVLVARSAERVRTLGNRLVRDLL